jgi:hypothetical protein
MQALNLCILKQNHFCCRLVILPKIFWITVFFKTIMFTLPFPFQVVNLPDPILCCWWEREFIILCATVVIIFTSNLNFALDFAFRLNENHFVAHPRIRKRPTPPTRQQGSLFVNPLGWWKIVVHQVNLWLFLVAGVFLRKLQAVFCSICIMSVDLQLV